jgi:hypothetical protein
VSEKVVITDELLNRAHDVVVRHKNLRIRQVLELVLKDVFSWISEHPEDRPKGEVREVELWEMKWGRVTTYTTYLVADGWDEAVRVAVDRMNSEDLDTKYTLDHIKSLTQMDRTVFVRV